MKYIGTLTTAQLKRRQRQKPTLISLFSGCGGAALGCWQAGFEVRAFVEFDYWACQTLHLNWVDPKGMCKQKRKPAILRRDITKLSTHELLEEAGLQVGEADLLEAGFPCQGFSTSGKRMIDDPRNQLYREMVRIVREALPKTLFLENVPGLVSMAKGAIMRQICDDIAVSGYDVKWDILDAANYGVPQRRRRVIFLCKRVDAMTLDMVSGRMRLVMAAAGGTVYHPDWFEAKYPPRKAPKKFAAFAAKGS